MNDEYTICSVLCSINRGQEVLKMKTKEMHVIAGFTMFVLCISVCITAANATVIWQDNFDDPNLPGWTTFAYETAISNVIVEGNFSAESGILTVLDDDLNFARHNSIVNVGTWSFDMFVPDIEVVEGAIYVYIMSNGSRAIPTYPSDFIAIGAWKQGVMPSWNFISWTLKGFQSIIHSSITRDPVQGWHHIDISRTSDGHFYIYFNGTFEDDFTYNDVTTSTYLEFYCYSANGAAIDNLVVNDTPIEPTLTPTTTSPPLPWDLSIIGSGIAVVLIVLVIVFLRRR